MHTCFFRSWSTSISRKSWAHATSVWDLIVVSLTCLIRNSRLSLTRPEICMADTRGVLFHLGSLLSGGLILQRNVNKTRFHSLWLPETSEIETRVTACQWALEFLLLGAFDRVNTVFCLGQTKIVHRIRSSVHSTLAAYFFRC